MPAARGRWLTRRFCRVGRLPASVVPRLHASRPADAGFLASLPPAPGAGAGAGGAPGTGGGATAYPGSWAWGGCLVRLQRAGWELEGWGSHCASPTTTTYCRPTTDH